MISPRRFVGLALLSAALVSASCSSDSDSSSTSPAVTSASETTGASQTTGGSETSIPVPADGFSVAASLRQIPAVVVDTDDDSSSTIQIAASDLNAASVLAGAERPRGATDVDAVTHWLYALNGPVPDGETQRVASLLPEASQYRTSYQVDKIADELGWSIADVHSFVEYQVPPVWFTVMNGSFSADALINAVGEPEGDIWSLGGVDSSTDLLNTTAARPRGESLRMALHNDTLAVALSTPPIEAWLALDGDDAEGTLAADDGLLAVATALDQADVYSALLVKTDSGAPSIPPPPIGTASAGLGPLVDVGVGLSVDDGEPLAVFVYYYADEESAAAGVDVLTKLIENGVSFRTNQPWSEAFAIRAIGADGQVLTATVEFKDFFPASVWGLIYSRDNLVGG